MLVLEIDLYQDNHLLVFCLNHKTIEHGTQFQTQDLKFTIHKAVFSSTSGTVTLTNDNIGDAITVLKMVLQLYMVVDFFQIH